MPSLTPEAVSIVTAMARQSLESVDGVWRDLVVRAYVVEALMTADPSLAPEAAMALTGAGSTTTATLLASVMSQAAWRPKLVDHLVERLRIVVRPPHVRVTLHRRVPVSHTAAICGDPLPGRSALDRLAAGDRPTLSHGVAA